MEKEKLLVDIIKIRLLFFSAVVGGSFGYLLKNNNYVVGVILIFTLFAGVIGVVKALYELGVIYKKLRDSNEGNF